MGTRAGRGREKVAGKAGKAACLPARQPCARPRIRWHPALILVRSTPPPPPPPAAGRVINSTYGRRVALHEAGHFLTAYLLGLLPRGYTLSSLDLFIRWVG